MGLKMSKEKDCTICNGTGKRSCGVSFSVCGVTGKIPVFEDD